ncbi:2317_t:CDS:2, partial [Cetraspora pellucida]
MSQSSNNSETKTQVSTNTNAVVLNKKEQFCDKQNAFLNKEHRPFLKEYKFVLDKDKNIVNKVSREYLLELLYTE